MNYENAKFQEKIFANRFLKLLKLFDSVIQFWSLFY